MADYLTPGVDIEEIPIGPAPIKGVSTSTVGMSGVTERGPAEPRLITSWQEYQDQFGGFVDGAFLPPAVQGFFENGGRRAYVASAADARTGLAALEGIDEISILLAPDEVSDSSGSVTNAVIEQCERRKDRFAIVSAPRDVDRVDALVTPRESSYAAFYAPWVRVLDPARTQPLLVPASGHVAGIYARVDLERGMHKAPVNEVVHGLFPRDAASGLEPLQVTITTRQQEVLTPRGVNVIRDLSAGGRGVRVWGARTMSADSLWKYVNVRRLFIFVEKSIDKGMPWVVFEPNSETTWSHVHRIVGNFLLQLWLNGTLMGTRPEEAFFVKCDRTTMTQDDIDNGRLICLIGIAPVRPAEFVIFRISQKTADAS